MTAVHPARPSNVGLRLYGRRVVLRPLVAQDFNGWSEVRRRNGEWLTQWEPMRLTHHPDPETNREVFAARCGARERERLAGTQFAFGIFVDGAFAGEINLNNVVRGAFQSATIGYWIDKSRAGRSLMSEAVVVLAQYAFEEMRLHRLEICIIPRNVNSRRVMEKLDIRTEGVAERFLEINGVWEDHIRYGITYEEWNERRAQIVKDWIGD
ncbi:MAG: putative acetyltransferase [actinobacterium acAcidi]|jgi:[ribosomal protein S5]-alanine N-acetyltransferase|nr:MAG: putative acetyltransferase [actinobacterium acAcidi]